MGKEGAKVNRSLQDAFTRGRAVFLQYDGVVGVGHGPKLKGRSRRVVSPESIIVLVERKLPPSEVPEGQLVPPNFEGFPTDVREPVLSVETPAEFDPNRPPDDPSQGECLTDNEWIDWGKINELNARQRREQRQGSRRRTRGGGAQPAGDEPAEDAPTVQVVDELFVIMDPDSTLVTTVGTSQTINWVGAYNLLRSTFGDDYDFVAFFVDVGSGMPDVGNASNTIFNNVTGIGLGATNTRATWSSTKLLRRTHHSWFSLRTMLHELAHQWLFYVDYRETAAGTTQDLLHQDWVWDAGQSGFHWGRWPDNDHSCMDYDRADWTANGDGTFNRTRHFENSSPDDVWFGYHSLDQYLMGLIPASSVSSVTVVQNPSPAQSDAVTGPYTPSPGTVTVGVSKVQFEEGARSPDYLNGQRVFHQATVVVTKSTTATTTFVTDSQTWRSDHTARFRRATSGRAMVDTSLLRANHANLYLRDSPSDTGIEPSSGAFWVSPDLWVRNADDNGVDHQCPIRGQANWIYVRVRNKDAQPYNNVTVNVYRANFLSLTPGTEFLYPVDWNPDELLGSATLATIPAASGGADGTAIAKIQWTAAKIPPAAGWHPCILGEVIPMVTSPSGLHHVWENRKLAQRNLTIIDIAGGCPPTGDAGDVLPEAVMFVSAFTIGHTLRPPQPTELRLSLLGDAPGVHLFLDPAGLVDGLEEEAALLNLEIPIGLGAMPPDEATVQGIHRVDFQQFDAGSLAGRPSGPLSGSVLVIPAGTEVGVLSGCDDDIEECTLRVRFCSETRLEVGFRRRGRLAEKYGLKGFQPVVLNRMPLLAVSDPRDARVMLRLGAGQTPVLRLIGLVSPYRASGDLVRCDVTEQSGSQILGGLSIDIGV